jgi:hypothetical protein
MIEQLRQLEELHAQLHEVNLEFAQAALPLAGASDMTDEQRRQIGSRLRAAQARWEAVARQISQVLETGIADVQ